MEQTKNITRSAIYEEIHSIVKQIPRKDVEGDAMDAPSASYLIEQLFKKLQQHSVMQAEGSDVSEGAAVGQRSVDTGVSVDEVYCECGRKRTLVYYCNVCDNDE
jgi:hypothetical protein